MAKKFVAECAREHSTCRLFPQMVSIFSRDCDHNQRKECDITQHRNKHGSRGFLDQWLTKKTAPYVVGRTNFGLSCTRRSWLRSTLDSVLWSYFKTASSYGNFSKISWRSSAWFTGNGFADDTTEYATKFHGKWISTKVNCLSALFSRMSILIKPRGAS